MATAIFRPGDKPLVNLGLLAVTAVTTTLTYRLVFASGPTRWDALADSLQFSLTLLLILGSHEMGHYLLARYHKVDTSLPYFIPTPPPLGVGTLGAVIRIRGKIPTLNALVDIGAAGPLAGLLIAIPVLFIGMHYGTVIDVPVHPDRFPHDGSLIAALPRFGQWLIDLIRGNPSPPQPANLIFGDNLLMKAATWSVFGTLPAGKDVVIPPALIAAWFGLLVTMLNLIPIGQLDGGHLAYAIFGKRARWIGAAAVAAMAALTLFWSWSWIVWSLITWRLVGLGHPPVTDPAAPLSRGRKLVCLLCLVAFIVCVLPVPMRYVSAS